MELDICEEMEGLGSIPEISALQVGDVSKPAKRMGSGSSDTAGKQSSKLSHQYSVLRKIPTTVNSLLKRRNQAASPGNRSKHHYRLDFFVQGM